ncbi:tyrosine-type recombinase/integrase [Shimia thalassica]|uniref:tyrosine-type recombinase/integrase n=1 Tax=Shimia thalassica TaxID=1715693 RepID=UPI001C09C0CB|nr:tyrosine-type recombinase/integrase [Shimia thalassica]MBU2941917.1 tyrosine-type recombinase/integrase [Shimia thalassica]MDO6503114.1 tyrosine-type recombinase/integrase [Shimia thalassica]
MKHLNASGRFKSGNLRYYFRPPGQKGIPLPDAPADSPEFLKAYLEAEKGNRPADIRARFKTGTIGSAVQAYKASDHFLSRAASTRDVWRRTLDDIQQRYGKGHLADLKTRHVRQDLAPLKPHPANNRLKVWRALARFWVDAGMLDHDPARDVRKRQAQETGGHTAWARDDVKAFRNHWPIHTQQRLAFELMHRTCASIGDACRLGPSMVKDGWLTYRRQKSGSMATVPMLSNAPDWFEFDTLLEDCLKHHKLALTYIQTAQGRPKSNKSAAQWFSRACNDAGLPDLSAHGIRKHRAAVFRENGASEDQRMAILGHETHTEAQNYSRSADLQKVITGTKLPTQPEPVGKNVFKILK